MLQIWLIIRRFYYPDNFSGADDRQTQLATEKPMECTGILETVSNGTPFVKVTEVANVYLATCMD